MFKSDVTFKIAIIAEYEGEYEKAKDLRRIAQNTWTEPHFQIAFQELADMIERYNTSTEQKGVEANGER